jgi:hypothetical protein
MAARKNQLPGVESRHFHIDGRRRHSDVRAKIGGEEAEPYERKNENRELSMTTLPERQATLRCSTRVR